MSGENLPEDTISSRHADYSSGRAFPRSHGLFSKQRARVRRMFERFVGNRVTGTIYKFVHNIFADNVIGVAAQTAFYLLMSLFPLVLAITSFVARLPLDVDEGIMQNLFPKQVLDALGPVISNTPTTASSTIIPIVLSVWSASSGIWALMRGVCISHTGNLPNYFKGRLLSMVLMLGFLVMIVVSLGLWVFGADVISWLSSTFSMGQGFLYIARYVFATMLLFMFVLSVYMVTPGVNVKRRYMMWGALFAAVGWELVSFMFEIYMNRFFKYSVLYGGVGVFIGLAIWLLAICMVILLGAELNALVIGLKGSKAAKNKRKRRLRK